MSTETYDMAWSKMVYNHIIRWAKNCNIYGNKSPLLTKYSNGGCVKFMELDKFLEHPQDRNSLRALLEDIKANYERFDYTELLKKEPVLHEVSKRIFDYIKGELSHKENIASKSMGLKLLNKYMDTTYIRYSTFEGFMKNPQDKESLVALLEEIKGAYIFLYDEEELFEESNHITEEIEECDILNSTTDQLIETFNKELAENKQLEDKIEDLRKDLIKRIEEEREKRKALLETLFKLESIFNN